MLVPTKQKWPTWLLKHQMRCCLCFTVSGPLPIHHISEYQIKTNCPVQYSAELHSPKWYHIHRKVPSADPRQTNFQLLWLWRARFSSLWFPILAPFHSDMPWEKKLTELSLVVCLKKKLFNPENWCFLRYWFPLTNHNSTNLHTWPESCHRIGTHFTQNLNSLEFCV